MDEISGVIATKKMSSKTIASLEGARCAESLQVVSELQELKEVQAEITHALNLMNEIRDKLETAYDDLAP
ncbi:MAG: hypothetical protein S4CHLAM81_00620 [Chlamydiales bacterium]|nr:hypothetical protein [Chlamydiales bacterium]MCH9634864.1 hypothetical protein [Chlamydiales bacterium]MCH9704152.1 hypothetical protein [Chlamydiota bacterium]